MDSDRHQGLISDETVKKINCSLFDHRHRQTNSWDIKRQKHVMSLFMVYWTANLLVTHPHVPLRKYIPGITFATDRFVCRCRFRCGCDSKSFSAAAWCEVCRMSGCCCRVRFGVPLTESPKGDGLPNPLVVSTAVL